MASLRLGPVLVLDAWERMAIGVSRSLGLRGIEVGVGGCDPETDYAACSRYTSRYHLLPDPRGPAEPYERALHGVVREHGYVAIVATHDATLARLASIELPAPGLTVLDDAWFRVQDKVALGDICARLGIAYPDTELVDGGTDVARLFERLGGAPVFVKSARTAFATPEAVTFQRGAERAETAADAEAGAALLLRDGLPTIAQAGIAHVDKLNAVLLRRDGRSELRYAHRVLREHPQGGGIGITLQTIPADAGDGAECADVLEAVCADVGLEGIVQAELYRGVDGRLYLVDVNPRLWGSIWFAERLGLHVVERSIRAALGLEPLPPPYYPVGRRFHVLSTELRWIQAHASKPAAVADVLRHTRPWDVLEFVHLPDPAPNVRWLRHQLRAARRGRTGGAERPAVSSVRQEPRPVEGDRGRA